MAFELRSVALHMATLSLTGFFSIEFPKVVEMRDFYENQSGRLRCFGIDNEVNLLAEAEHDITFYTMQVQSASSKVRRYVSWHLPRLEIFDPEEQEDGTIELSIIAHAGIDSPGLTFAEISGPPPLRDVAP